MSENLESKKTNSNSIGIKLFLSLVVMSISVLAGCASGCVYYNQTVEPTPEWRNLGRPPEPIEELVDADFFTVYVRGESGQLYSYYWESPYAFDGWNPVEEIPEYKSFCNEASFREPELPMPPFGTTVESLYARFCSNWAGNPSSSLAVYHLLDNGEVVQWYRNDTFPFIAGYFGKFLLNSFVGLAAGLAVGIFVCARIWHANLNDFLQRRKNSLRM